MLKPFRHGVFQRLSSACHTPASKKEVTKLEQLMAPGSQAWADCEEKMTDFYSTLLLLNKLAEIQQHKSLDTCVSHLFRDYSAVLAAFAVYLEVCGNLT